MLRLVNRDARSTTPTWSMVGELVGNGNGLTGLGFIHLMLKLWMHEDAEYQRINL